MGRVCEEVLNGKLESLGIFLWLSNIIKKGGNMKFVF